MATTGELRAIIEELELVDIGDAASYLGEEANMEEELLVSDPHALLFANKGLATKNDFIAYQGR